MSENELLLNKLEDLSKRKDVFITKEGEGYSYTIFQGDRKYRTLCKKYYVDLGLYCDTVSMRRDLHSSHYFYFKNESERKKLKELLERIYAKDRKVLDKKEQKLRLKAINSIPGETLLQKIVEYLKRKLA